MIFFFFFFRFSKCFKTVSFVSGSLLEETGAGFMHQLLGCLQAESQSASQLCSQASGALPTALSLPASLGEREEDCWMALGWKVAMWGLSPDTFLALLTILRDLSRGLTLR